MCFVQYISCRCVHFLIFTWRRPSVVETLYQSCQRDIKAVCLFLVSIIVLYIPVSVHQDTSVDTLRQVIVVDLLTYWLDFWLKDIWKQHKAQRMISNTDDRHVTIIEKKKTEKRKKSFLKDGWQQHKKSGDFWMLNFFLVT